MCQEVRSVWNVCAHFKDKTVCKRVSPDARVRCPRKTAEVEIVLGWCPACHDYIANAHKRFKHHRKLDPKDEFVIKNYWALKSWYACDRTMEINQISLSMLDTEDPLIYRVTMDRPNITPARQDTMPQLAKKKKTASFGLFTKDKNAADDDGGGGESTLEEIRPMPAWKDGYNFEMAAVCWQCRDFKPQKTFCKEVNPTFKASHCVQVYDLIAMAHRLTATRYAKKLRVDKKTTLPKPGMLSRLASWRTAKEESSGELESTLDWLVQSPWWPPVNVPDPSQEQQPGDEIKEVATRHRKDLVEWAIHGRSAWMPGLFRRAVPPRPAVAHAEKRMEIEDLMHHAGLLCDEHDRNWASECRPCRISRVVYWFLTTTWRGYAGDPEVPPSP
ncbi:hypothetical protein ACRE_065640 [Hapsidospora chrysogenum ATCC 11550]|uniref:Uncharacterized protein n=1 Tax=Hapsidospora chrysogenum (strain ATCC 11550 / CBS 779.69 / DSM 880 / IAM 14645 / JCM 23072 / IMI 49137) TaxID=857340 RepID=A0A086T034_HAPC1|nr:hypothetical protein ACRE_065640 [Hapsidospora chrysogenum ATCC 11550]